MPVTPHAALVSDPISRQPQQEATQQATRTRPGGSAVDPGYNEVDFFNKKAAPGTHAAVSSFVKLSFNGSAVLIEYVDETFTTWGAEVWDSSKGRFGGTRFLEYDGVQQ